MKGDIVILEEHHRKAAKAIVARIAEEIENTPARYAMVRRFTIALLVALSRVATPLACYHWYLLLLIPLLVIVDRLHSQRPWRPPLLVVPLAAGVDANRLVCVLGRTCLLEQGLWRLLSFPTLLAERLWALCCPAMWPIRWWAGHALGRDGCL